jgi:hypothetical protein
MLRNKTLNIASIMLLVLGIVFISCTNDKYRLVRLVSAWRRVYTIHFLNSLIFDRQTFGYSG